MFRLVSSLVIRHPRAVVLGWLVLIAGLHYLAPPWDRISKNDDLGLFPADSPSVIGRDLLERGFPQDASSSDLVLIYQRKDGRLTPDDFRFVDREVASLSQLAREHPELGVKKIDTYRSPLIGPRLIGSRAHGADQAVLSIVPLDSGYLSRRTQLTVDRILEWINTKTLAPPPGLNRAVTGSATVGHDTHAATDESIEATTNATIALVMVILLIVYRSVLLAMVPLVTIALSVFASLRLIALLAGLPGLGLQVIDVTQIFVVVVLFGAGTDYCLFLGTRYREELGRGRSPDEALREAISRVGAAVVASAATVIIGLGMLGFSRFATFQYTGPTIALSLAVALVAALTAAPAMLAWLRTALFWPSRAPHHENGGNIESESRDALPQTGFWVRVAGLVVNYPLPICAACLAILVPLAVVGARTRSNYSQLVDLDPNRPSVVGALAVRSCFAVGELSPTVALIEHATLDFRSPQGRAAIKEMSRRLAALPGVAEVRSSTRPVGKPEESTIGESLFARLADRALRIAAEARYVATTPRRSADVNRITRLEIVFETDPFSESSLQILQDVRATFQRATAAGQPLEGANAIGLAGSTSEVSDLKRVTTSDQHRMYVLVTLGVYIVLVALLRRPGISLYLIATVLLGYLASLGVTDLLFRALHRGPAPWEGLDWTVGFFLFVILVAVGEDFNILLMARVIEEERKYGVVEGTRKAVAHTGGIISSCGLIMAGTFGSMLTGSLTSLRELGFALGVGVLLDTFLVRPILVPAFVILIERLRPRAASRQAGSEVPIGYRSPEWRWTATETTDVRRSSTAEEAGSSAGVARPPAMSAHESS
jgi:RND superfamily putative drug exporter